MSKRTAALAAIIGGALLVAAVPRPVAADGSFPLNCVMSDSATSTKPLVVTVKLSCGSVAPGDSATIDDASLIGPATVPFYSGTDIDWTKDVQVPVAGIYRLSVSGTVLYSQGISDSGTTVCCSVQAYGPAAATPTPEPPHPATPAPVSTPAPPAPPPKPVPATPAPTATPIETASPSSTPTGTPQPSPTTASAVPSASAQAALGPSAAPSSSPMPAAGGTGNQSTSGVSSALLPAAVASALALVLLVLLVFVVRRGRRHDDQRAGEHHVA
jgi:hypothetical protein